MVETKRSEEEGGKKGRSGFVPREGCLLPHWSFKHFSARRRRKKSKGSKILLTRTSSSSSSNAAAPGRQARIKSMSSQNVTHVIHLEEDKMSTNLSDERKKETEKEEKDDG